jgi:hypothetical protein
MTEGYRELIVVDTKAYNESSFMHALKEAGL